jgi:hypothetical protein
MLRRPKRASGSSPPSPGEIDRRDAHAAAGGARTSGAVDYEYARNGTANLFIMYAPSKGPHHVNVADHRAMVDVNEH